MSHRRDIARIALLGALVAALAVPGQALAEYYIPPGNSAANQYTEAYPTAGGDSGGKQTNEGRATPADTLGARNAERLESKGPTGAEAAAVAAETAPPPVADVPGDEALAQPGGGGGRNGSRQTGGGSERTTPAESPSGSSAFGEVVAQATGSADDGNLGLLLPIAILVTVAGSIAYLARRHRTGPTA